MIGRGRLCVAAPGLFYRETRLSVLRFARPLNLKEGRGGSP